MRRFIAFILFPASIALLTPSCGLFRKSQTARVPPPVTQKPVPQKTPPPPPKKENRPAPYDVKAFAKKVYRPVYNVALFVPLYVDQITSDSSFSVSDRTPLPAASLSGLEFYEGSLLAMDSLQQQHIPLHLFVYDTKSLSHPLSSVLASSRLDSANLIIGSVNSDELRQIAGFARKKQINFVSATYPNDGGITDNPFLTIVNSTLPVHCRAIQDFAQQKFTNKNIVLVYQNTKQDRQNMAYMEEAYKQMQFSRKTPLQPFEWANDTTAEKLLPLLSKDKNNVIILTTLYPQVAVAMISQLIPLTKTYTINVVGMPTLDGNQDLKKSEYHGLNIFYSTPYPYLNLADIPAIKSMMWAFFRRYRSRPSDMAIKGYETLFYFGEMLHRDGMYFNADLSSNAGQLLTDFNFTPIFHSGKDTKTPDYFENTHLYFMKIRDGEVMRAN